MSDFQPITLHSPTSASLSKDLLPLIRRQLHTTGFALCRPQFLEEQAESLVERYCLAFSVAAGSELGRTVGFHVLEGRPDSDVELALHTEGIHLSHGVFATFALACLRPSDDGGNTRVFDAIRAAALLRSERPELVDVVVRYQSGSYVEQVADHSIVEVDPDFGPVLLYRSGPTGKTLVRAPAAVSIESLDSVIGGIVERCCVLDHHWRRGDILFVNNKRTLHSRRPYSGPRRMLRVRYGDGLNASITL